MCNGQFLPINQNQALFSLLGTVYGGNGQTTFALPNLQGRVPMSMGNGHTLGERAGAEAHTVTISQMPTHTHFVSASSVATDGVASPANAYLGGASNAYHAPLNLTSMNPGTVANVGGSQPHLNMQPYLVLNFCIALVGAFPSES